MASPLETGIIGPSQADIAAADNTPRGPIRKSRVLTAVGAALGLGTPLLISACASPQRPAEVRTVSTPEPATPTTASVPGHTPIAIGISLPPGCQSDPDAVRGWDIATSKRPLTSEDNPFIDAFNACVAKENIPGEATATAIATTKPTATPTTILTAKPTKEATPIPKPENPLPSYGVFFGEVKDSKTGAKVAELVMASIPQKEGLDEIFMYYITSPSVAGTRYHVANQLKPSKIEGTYFELGGMNSYRTGVIPPWEKAEFNKETQTITGETYSIAREKTKGKESIFTLKLVGEGKETIFKAMRQVIKDQSSDQPTTPERELADFRQINPNNWP